MEIKEFGVIILAAGKGTRMKSDTPKVLHSIHGQTMISLVLRCASSLFGENIVVVVGHKAELVKAEIDQQFKVSYALQKELLGTGDAVRAAIPFLIDSIKNVLILCGDVPLIKKDTILEFVNFHIGNSYDISLFSVHLDKPTGYGRLIFNNKNELVSICEEADATPEQKDINLVNAGLYCIKKDFLVYALDLIDTDNFQKEYYLTDLVSIAFKNNSSIGCFLGNDPDEVIGINSVSDLKKVELILTKKIVANIQ
ncbi:MAG: NTP transferase domain-containing protein [Desulfamplus sp.]|nr:NTP transferase domain-containing protein [Desulfamplus sp.]MBF0390904.1 NTP transferase domain-containing protein [Desulfamplus sp.]